MFIGYKLCNSNRKGDLNSTSKTLEKFTPNDGVGLLSCSGDDRADQSEAIAANEEPTTAKDIGQTAYKEEADAEAESIGEGYPLFSLALKF